MATMPDLNEGIWQRVVINIKRDNKPIWMRIMHIAIVTLFTIGAIILVNVKFLPNDASNLAQAISDFVAGVIGASVSSSVLLAVVFVQSVFQQRDELRACLKELVRRSDLHITADIDDTYLYIDVRNLGPSGGSFFAKIESIAYSENGSGGRGRHTPFNARWRLGPDDENPRVPNWMPIGNGESEKLHLSNLGGQCINKAGGKGAEVTIYACHSNLQEQLCTDFFESIELKLSIMQDGYLSEPTTKTIRFKALNRDSEYWWDDAIEIFG